MFSRDGMKVAIGRIYDFQHKTALGEISGIGFAVPVGFTSDGKRIFVNHFDRVSVHRVDTGAKIDEIKLESREPTDMVVAVIGDGKQVVISRSAPGRRVNHIPVLFDTATGKGRKLNGPPVSCMECSVDGTLLVAGDHFGGVRLFSIPKARQILGPDPDSAIVETIVPTADGRLIATIDRTGRLRVWEPRTGRCLLRVTGERIPGESHNWKIMHAAFSRDGRRVYAACTDFRLRAWDTRSRKLLADKPSGHTENFSDLKPLGSGIISAGRGGFLRCWTKDLQLSRTVNLAVPIRSIDLSVDGSICLCMMSSGQFPHLVVCDLPSGQRRLVVSSEASKQIRGAVLVRDGKTVAVAWSDGTIRYWDVRRESAVRAGVTRIGLRLSFMARVTDDGTLLAVLGKSKRVHFVDTLTEKSVGTLNLTWPFAFRSNGTRMVTEAVGGALVWGVNNRLSLAPPHRTTIDRHEMLQCWNDLESNDPVVAWRAVWKLTSAGKPAAVFLRSRLTESRTRTAKDLQELFNRLDDPKFVVRRRATLECLNVLSPSARSDIERRLQVTRSIELKARLQLLLRAINQVESPPAPKRQLVRCIGVLERLNHSAAIQTLKQLAKADRRLLRSFLAHSALKRMEPHHAAKDQERAQGPVHNE